MRRYDELSEGERDERKRKLAEKALLAYGLSGELTPVACATSTVLRLRASGASYAVRVSPPGSDHTALRRELTWLAALGRDTVLAVPEPTLTLSGDLFRSVSMEGVPGTRACAVLRWVDGERREADITPDEASAMGRLAAALHAHAVNFRWPEELEPEVVDPASRALTAAEALRRALTLPDDRAVLCDAVTHVAEATGSLGDGAEHVGVIHGDLRLRRLRLDGGVFGVVGFRACRVGAYLDDLSVLWHEFAGRETAAALQDALVDGYRSVRALSLPDAALDAFVTLRALEEAAGVCAATRATRTDRTAAERAREILRRRLALQQPAA